MHQFHMLCLCFVYLYLVSVVAIAFCLNFQCYLVLLRCPGRSWQSCQLSWCHWGRNGGCNWVLGQFPQNMELKLWRVLVLPQMTIPCHRHLCSQKIWTIFLHIFQFMWWFDRHLTLILGHTDKNGQFENEDDNKILTTHTPHTESMYLVHSVLWANYVYFFSKYIYDFLIKWIFKVF